MNIKGNGDVSQLVRAIGDSNIRESQTTPSKAEGSPERRPEQVDAVKLDPAFGSGAASEQSSRVAALKEQVAQGQYNPPSQEVAAAVFKELFA